MPYSIEIQRDYAAIKVPPGNVGIYRFLQRCSLMPGKERKGPRRLSHYTNSKNLTCVTSPEEAEGC